MDAAPLLLVSMGGSYRRALISILTKPMLDPARHIVNQKAGCFDPEKFEDHYESALIDLIKQKRAGKVIRPKERPKGECRPDGRRHISII